MKRFIKGASGKDVTAEGFFWTRVRATLTSAKELLAERGKGYDQTSILDRFPFGQLSVATMVTIKASRLVSALKAEQAGKEIDKDSVDDTILDLINYAAFLAAYRETERVFSEDSEEAKDALPANSAD